MCGMLIFSSGVADGDSSAMNLYAVFLWLFAGLRNGNDIANFLMWRIRY